MNSIDSNEATELSKSVIIFQLLSRKEKTKLFFLEPAIAAADDVVERVDVDDTTTGVCDSFVVVVVVDGDETGIVVDVVEDIADDSLFAAASIAKNE